MVCLFNICITKATANRMVLPMRRHIGIMCGALCIDCGTLVEKWMWASIEA